MSKKTDAIGSFKEKSAIVRIIAFAFPVFFLLVAFLPVSDHVSHGAFIWFVWVLVIVAFPVRRGSERGSKLPWYDWVLLAVASFVCGFYIFEFERLINNLGYLEQLDRIVIIIALFLALETARRALGLVLPIIAIGSLVYTYWSGFLPSQIFTRLYLGDLGIFGTITDVFARYVILFFIFGNLMEKAGATEFFRKMINTLGHGVKGGPAKAAVVGSASMGTIMGASAGNVAVTGSLTIPMMKRFGYQPHKAAAIECAASLGGEITPPVMGAAVFLLVANTGIPYRELILISALPAVLYYLSVFATIHLEADRDAESFDQPAETRKRFWPYFLDYSHLLVPPIVLVLLIIVGYSPTYGAAGGILAAVLISQVRRKTRVSIRIMIGAFVDGALGFLTVGATAAVLGLILMGVVMGGLPVQFGSWAIGLTGGYLPLVILVVLLLGLFLGMGIPIVGAYLILATVAGPALEGLGIDVLAAHLLILWFVESAGITPPVALATFVASGIAESSIYRTAFTAMRLAIAVYAIPLLMIYTPLVTGNWLQRFGVFGWTAFGFLMLAMANAGYFKGRLGTWTRFGAGLAALFLFFPSRTLHIIAAVAGFAFLIWRLFSSRQIQVHVPARNKLISNQDKQSDQ